MMCLYAQVYPASVPNYLGGKGWMSCDVIRQSQMILIGGQFTNASAPECDVPKIGGQHGLLLGQENVELGAWWHGIVDNTTGYRVPDQIVAHVGGEYVSYIRSSGSSKANTTTVLKAMLQQQHRHRASSRTTCPYTSNRQPRQHHGQRQGPYQQQRQRDQQANQNPRTILAP